jgi:hypothetical protein
MRRRLPARRQQGTIHFMQIQCARCGELLEMPAGDEVITCPDCGTALRSLPSVRELREAPAAEELDLDELTSPSRGRRRARVILASIVVLLIPVVIGLAAFRLWELRKKSLESHPAPTTGGKTDEHRPPHGAGDRPQEVPDPAPGYRQAIVKQTRELGWEPAHWSEIKVVGQWTQSTLADLEAEGEEDARWQAENRKRKAEGLPPLPPPEKPKDYYTVVRAMKVDDGRRWAVFFVYRDGRVWGPIPESFGIKEESWEADVRHLLSSRS